MRFLLTISSVPVVLLVQGCGSLEFYGDELEAIENPPSPEDPSDPGDPDDPDDDPPPPDTDTDPGTTPEPPEPVDIEITSVEPNYGTNRGGVEVTINGTFDPAESAVVRFGGEPATVVDQQASRIVVETPNAGFTGWVNVEVEAGQQQDVLSDSFQYFEDGTGKAGTYGYLMYYDLVGDYWKDGSNFAQAMVGFNEPKAWYFWEDFTTSMNTCVFNHVADDIPTMYEPDVASLELDSGGSLVTMSELTSLGAGVYGNAAVVPGSEATPGDVYDLIGDSASPDWPVFDVPGAVQIPNAFSLTLPDMDPNVGQVDRSIDLSWTGSGGDYMVIWILRQNMTTYTNDGIVSCAVDDTGSFTVPAGTWPTWQVGDFLHIQVGRVFEGTGTLPHNNSENRLPGVYWYYGGARGI